jgi:hypothetical protein
MRYRLRTLLVATAIGPPILAAIWFNPDIVAMVCLGEGFLFLVALVAYFLLALVTYRWH